MSQLSPILRDTQGGGLMFWCLGCGCAHIVYHDGTHRTHTDAELQAAYYGKGPEHPKWNWNGSVTQPTFTPSILVRSRRPKGYSNENPAPVGWQGEYEQTVCHSFVTDGAIQFLSDCTHELAEKTMPLPEWPE